MAILPRFANSVYLSQPALPQGTSQQIIDQNPAYRNGQNWKSAVDDLKNMLLQADEYIMALETLLMIIANTSFEPVHFQGTLPDIGKAFAGIYSKLDAFLKNPSAAAFEALKAKIAAELARLISKIYKYYLGGHHDSTLQIHKLYAPFNDQQLEPNLKSEFGNVSQSLTNSLKKIAAYQAPSPTPLNGQLTAKLIMAGPGNSM
ncbi:MAG: hypothetical protein C5B47_00775 [Verrucomicrobia bacterium]|nr:MAG: hypothetical protein C5B47_00775 [Verrucomicrobiota bacterium]